MKPADLDEMLEESPVHRGLRIRVGESAPGSLVLEAQPGIEHSLGDDSTLHGGLVATLLDTAATFALINETGSDWSTVDIRVDYLRPAPIGRLLLRSRPVHAGRRFGRAAAELVDPASGKTLAACTGTFVRAAEPTEEPT